MDLANELLKRAFDSILDGHTRTETDYEGRTYEIKVGSLRDVLVGKIAEQIMRSPDLTKVITDKISQEVIDKILERALSTIKYGDIPRAVKSKIDKQMEESKVRLIESEVIIRTVNK